ncbi:hypothetical protein DN817_23755 [Escherichia coli]|nr:hypothetical protein [Escherichia coli]EGD8230045.1 hypothetical protein [Escherichia coli]EGD8926131.1 hypothetical protein [Escherichia coli]EGD8972002.1 hypothetical protein [Escherichia coli]EGD9111418.1 hypothetical protein [Escherichia coli]
MEQPLSMSATKQIGKARIVFPQCMIKTSILNQALVKMTRRAAPVLNDITNCGNSLNITSL